MTPAQRAALEILAIAFPDRVEGHKRRSQMAPVRRVNMIAAGSLCRMGLARGHLAQRTSPYTHDEKYSATQAGLAALEVSG